VIEEGQFLQLQPLTITRLRYWNGL